MQTKRKKKKKNRIDINSVHQRFYFIAVLYRRIQQKKCIQFSMEKTAYFMKVQ